MKTKTLALAAMITVAALAMPACSGGGDDAEGQLIPVTAIVAKNRYQFLLVDMRTGTPIADPLTVRLAGPAVDDGEVVDWNNASARNRTYTIADGLFAAGANFDGRNDVFTLTAGNLAGGWNTTGVQVLGETSREGDQLVVVKLANLRDAAAINASATPGVAMAVATAAVSGGTSSVPITLATPARLVTNLQGAAEPVGTARVTIPAGTVMRDAAGQPASGSVTLTVTKYSNNEEGALSAFPGGFTAQVADPGGTQLPGGATSAVVTFVSGGFAQFNLTDSDGRAITNFDTPVVLAIDLPRTSRNPATGALVQAGDTYPVWRFDEAGGRWTFEGQGAIRAKVPPDADHFEVVFAATHLSYWNLDYRGESCGSHLRITGRPANDLTPLRITITGLPGTSFYRAMPYVIDSRIELAHAPDLQVRIAASTMEGALVGRLDDVNLCGPGDVPLHVRLPQFLPDGNVDPDVVTASLLVRVAAACTQDRLDEPPTEFIETPVWFVSDDFRIAASGTSEVRFDLGSGARGSYSVHGNLYVWDPFERRTITQHVIVSGGAPFGTTILIQSRKSPPCRSLTGASGN